MFSKLLVANRGEIACRVMRTARALGIRTVAIFSEADRGALHVRSADEAVLVGPAPANQSYLDIERVVEAARRTGADAVHPGYGFLSENTAFAEALERAGIVFVGPPVAAIAAMGSKSEAKRIMIDAGVPTLPSYHDADQDPATLLEAAKRIGFPVLLKAVAGGGGKGMRRVDDEDAFAHALEGARREGEASFGDGAVLVEKYLAFPRHVEVQVFADTRGHAVAFFERDCSLQRRYQKVIEEAPAPGLSAQTRKAMAEAAVAAAEAIGYVGAGTVEFLLGPDEAFYFLEMNTRLQVEHPVTEMVTGEDLVAWQLAVAAGRPLPKTQAELVLDGHAFEARVYAEDPERGFLPSPGRLETVAFPLDRPGIRVDTGVESGDTVPVHYDPMMAKVIAFGPDRETARRRLVDALSATRIDGPMNNLAFLASLAQAPEFAAGAVDTGFIDRQMASRDAEVATEAGLVALAGLYLALRPVPVPAASGDPHSPWRRTDAWRLNQPFERRVGLVLTRCGITQRVSVVGIDGRGSDRYRVSVGEDTFDFDARVFENADGLTVETDGHRFDVRVTPGTDGFELAAPTGRLAFTPEAPDLGAPAAGELAGRLTAPMTGNVVAVLVEAGATVEAGTPLVVIEAMKMEHTVSAPVSGRVRELFFAAGDFIEGGAQVLDFEPDPD